MFNKWVAYKYGCDYNSHYEKFLATGEVKCIEEEIPFEIPKGWEWCRMGNIGDWGAGATPAKGNPTYYGGSILWLRTGELNNGVVSDTEIKITDKALEECSLRMNKVGDVLIAMYGATIGKVAIAGKMMTTNQACCACTPFGIYNYYLFFFLMASQIDFIKKGEGGAQPNISREKLISHLMPIPPLAEQYRIVEKIQTLLPLTEKYSACQVMQDKLNSDIKDKLRKSILQEAIQGRLVPQIVSEGSATELLTQIKTEKQKLVKEGKLKKSVLTDSVIFRGDDNKYYEQVGGDVNCIDDEIPFEIPERWAWCRLGELAELYTGNSISESEKRAKYTNVEGVCYIGTKDVSFNHKIDYENGIAVPPKYISKFKIAPAESILLCVEGGSAGKKIAFTHQDVCFGNKLCCFAFFAPSSADYAYYYLQSASFYDSFSSNVTGIIGGVGAQRLKNLLLPLPPIDEQRRIVAQIEKLFEQLR